MLDLNRLMFSRLPQMLLSQMPRRNWVMIAAVNDSLMWKLMQQTASRLVRS